MHGQQKASESTQHSRLSTPESRAPASEAPRRGSAELPGRGRGRGRPSVGSRSSLSSAGSRYCADTVLWFTTDVAVFQSLSLMM